MDKKLKVGIVSYLNTKPLLYGLQLPPINQQIELIEDHPAHLAAMLVKDEIDLGLIPVAAIPRLSEYFIVGDYCIGTEGEIASVGLFSEVPMNEIKKVYLDYQSRTSVALLKWLTPTYPAKCHLSTQCSNAFYSYGSLAELHYRFRGAQWLPLDRILD